MVHGKAAAVYSAHLLNLNLLNEAWMVCGVAVWSFEFIL